MPLPSTWAAPPLLLISLSVRDEEIVEGGRGSGAGGAEEALLSSSAMAWRLWFLEGGWSEKDGWVMVGGHCWSAVARTIEDDRRELGWLEGCKARFCPSKQCLHAGKGSVCV